MTKFEESDFYKALQDFFINADKKTFIQFLAEFYNRTEGIIDKNNIQDDLIKELRELYLEFNEKGIDNNVVIGKVNYFLENNVKIKDIISKLNTNTNNIEQNTKQMISKRIENVFGNNKCILHRGASTVAPEQTRASFQLAKKLGVKVVELDVWKTIDNDFVVFHDSTLDDKTTGTGKVEDKTLAELKLLSFTKGANLDKYPNLKILSFDECMKLLKELGLNALIDFKTYTLDSNIYLKLINIIKTNGMISNVAIATWYGSQIKVIRDLEKDICLGIEQVGNESEWSFILNNNIDFAFLTKGTYLTQENIKRLHDNYRYYIGFSVDKLDDIKMYIDYGCDYFVTDNIFEGGI